MIAPAQHLAAVSQLRADPTIPLAVQATIWPDALAQTDCLHWQAPLPKALMALQVDFASIIAATHRIPFATALLDYTTAHRRAFHHPDKGIDPRWWGLARALPSDPARATDMLQDAYLGRQSLDRLLPAKQVSKHGTFSFEYRARKNQFMLHFQGNDPRGNLGRDRMVQRQAELREMTAAIARHAKPGASVRMSSWLLDIEAFNRLMPAAFRDSAVPVLAEKTQDMGLWGQFADGRGGVKTALAKTLLDRARNPLSAPAEAFPSKERTASVPQEVFFDTYLDWTARVFQARLV